MTNLVKPMKAVDAITDKIKFPVIASPKIDGVRVTYQNDTFRTNSLKVFPNEHINQIALNAALNGLDGEFVIGSPEGEGVLSRTISAVMSKKKPIDGLTFFAFDCFPIKQGEPFKERHTRLMNSAPLFPSEFIRIVPHVTVFSQEHLDEYESEIIGMGYEGAMIRDPNGWYKEGRSTVNEGLLLKIKRFQDSEAIVIDFEQAMHNENPATMSELGLSTRATRKANLTPKDELGALVVKDLKTGVQFNIGTGFTSEQRREIWQNKSDYLGQYAKYKFFPVGVKDKPRHPVFIHFRPSIDMA